MNLFILILLSVYHWYWPESEFIVMICRNADLSIWPIKRWSVTDVEHVFELPLTKSWKGFLSHGELLCFRKNQSALNKNRYAWNPMHRLVSRLRPSSNSSNVSMHVWICCWRQNKWVKPSSEQSAFLHLHRYLTNRWMNIWEVNFLTDGKLYDNAAPDSLIQIKAQQSTLFRLPPVSKTDRWSNKSC